MVHRADGSYGGSKARMKTATLPTTHHLLRKSRRMPGVSRRAAAYLVLALRAARAAAIAGGVKQDLAIGDDALDGAAVAAGHLVSPCAEIENDADARAASDHAKDGP
jgi:hypothetical protein